MKKNCYMSKPILISLPTFKSISILKTISIELKGYSYTPQLKDSDNIVLYKPQSADTFLHFSFMPIITVEVIPEISGVMLSITGRLNKIIRAMMTFFAAILILMQGIFIKWWIAGEAIFPIPGLVPVFMLLFMIGMSAIGKYSAFKAFVAKYRKQIEKAMEQQSYVNGLDTDWE